MEQAHAFIACSDVNFYDALKVLRAVVNNVCAHPTEPKYRRVNTQSAAFRTRVAAAEGAMDVLRALGFHMQADGHLVLPEGAPTAGMAAELDRIEAAHEQHKKEKARHALADMREREARATQQIQQQIHADRVAIQDEREMHEVHASHAQTVPFSGRSERFQPDCSSQGG
mmetsp:Transcript_33089/g.83169  ORF Transcript_33089/g.83169 Transcript_33089/m.83169 type:complete len:170 (+) Transcript_33089:97-606(+)|eukprot:CAMPEP_0177650346 /NCGR_PEP_ID=MMETSP0447-20121125/11892_1 /TAXON_ID=0 /ORGANISM="Stygamoeba regulata, Strain BSH-02190019" /LENGTH=169 /DNA_ID=CAMNT_0019153207 /DNA_START=90 /DNA_END=599 /DNA_ORIENTATION=+